LSAAGRRDGDSDPGARRPERARHFPCLAGGAGGRRPLRPAALPVARPRQRPGVV
ncbi:yegB, partial [Klebsiella pneumoniae]